MLNKCLILFLLLNAQFAFAESDRIVEARKIAQTWIDLAIKSYQAAGDSESAKFLGAYSDRFQKI